MVIKMRKKKTKVYKMRIIKSPVRVWAAAAAAICLLLLLLRGYQYADWPYLYRNDVSRSALENADEYKECSCIYVFEEKWK